MTKLRRASKQYGRLSGTSRMDGFGIVGWIVAIPFLLIGLVVIAFVFFEARKAYWDHRVREMCEKDGGVTVYEEVLLSPEEYKRLGGIHSGGLPVPAVNNKKKKDYPYFYETVTTKIRDYSPEVRRSETFIRRRSDAKLLGISIYYGRRGGDFLFRLGPDSSFGCPHQTRWGESLFKVKE